MLADTLKERGIGWPLLSLLGALLLAGLGPQVIDMEGTLPLSLQSLLVCWIPLMLGWRAGLVAILLYLTAGAAGLPVFAGHKAGMDVIAGPTGGYLLGFPIVAFVLGLIGNASQNRPLRERYLIAAGAMVLGHGLILTLGIPWQMRFDSDLDPGVLLQRLGRPVALKSAIGMLLSVLAIRSAQGRA
jgi:biotin transport system substrate-specific component